MNTDREKILAAAEGYREDMISFLRKMISIPSESAEEEGVVSCIMEEMKKNGFEDVGTDGLGDVIGSEKGIR